MIYTPRIRISPPEIFLKNICFSNQYFHVCRGSNIVVGYEEELAEDADTSNSSLCRPKETNRRTGLIGNKYVSVAFLKRQKNQTSSFTPIVHSDRSILCGKTKVPLTKLRNMYCEYGELFPIPFDK